MGSGLSRGTEPGNLSGSFGSVFEATSTPSSKPSPSVSANAGLDHVSFASTKTPVLVSVPLGNESSSRSMPMRAPEPGGTAV